MAKSIRRVSVLLGVALCVTGNAAEPLAASRQCIVVVTESWSSTNGTMSIFQRGHNSKWKRRSTFPVVVGKAGLGWGRGLIDTNHLFGPRKREGDDKAPAGIFPLTSVFGREKQTRMPFVETTPNVICVDDPGSRYYNRIIDANRIDKRDWRHAEKLFGVEDYKMGIIVEHNVPPQRGAGSCIFLHVWQSPATPTSGCTAMSEKNLAQLIRWLDPAKQPRLIQLPRPVYNEFRAAWDLP